MYLELDLEILVVGNVSWDVGCGDVLVTFNTLYTHVHVIFKLIHVLVFLAIIYHVRVMLERVHVIVYLDLEFVLVYLEQIHTLLVHVILEPHVLVNLDILVFVICIMMVMG